LETASSMMIDRASGRVSNASDRFRRLAAVRQRPA
jgi:hypothetical protein